MRRLFAFGLLLALLCPAAGGTQLTVTRGEFVCWLWESCGSVPYDSSHGFSDVDKDDPWAEAICWAQGEALVLGDGTGRFLPKELLTHAQLELILSRADVMLGRQETRQYLPGAWPEDPVCRTDAQRALEQWRGW